jgi:sugar-specific transcriptional regulator TrmB
MDNKLIETLKTMGYSDKEALAYLTLLELGQATAYSIAEKSGLKKPTAHVILGELLKKGAVITIPGAKKKMFAARHPEDLFAQAEKKLNLAKKSLPTLLSLGAKSKSEFKTMYFEGIKGLEDALRYKSESSEKQIVGFYAMAEKIKPEVIKIFDKWSLELQNNSFSIRGLTPEHTSTERYRSLDKQTRQDIRPLPLDMYSSDISIEAQDTFVRITDIQNLQTVIIDNPHIAKTVKQIFELVWKKY